MGWQSSACCSSPARAVVKEWHFKLNSPLKTEFQRVFSHTFIFCLDPKCSVGCPMEGCSCGLVSITLMSLELPLWVGLAASLSLSISARQSHLLWHELESCLALGWSSCHLQPRAVQWCSFDFVPRISGIWGTCPSLSAFPFHFPLFLPLSFFFPSFLFPSLLGFMLISCRRKSATATGLFNTLLINQRIIKISNCNWAKGWLRQTTAQGCSFWIFRTWKCSLPHHSVQAGFWVRRVMNGCIQVWNRS